MLRFVDKKPSVGKYGKYFLANEAPGDPDDVSTINAIPADEYSPAANTRVINVTPGQRTRRLIFDDPDDAGQAAPPADTAAPAPATPPAPVDPNAPQVADSGPGQGMPDPNGPDTTDPGNVGDAGTVDTPAPEEGGNGPITDDGGDNLNFADTDGDGTPDAPPPDDPNAQKGYGIEVDSIRKYNLFKDLIVLDTTLNGFIEKLENALSDDASQNKAVMDAHKKLRETRDIVHDYMILRFESDTWGQALLFYKTMQMTVNVILNRLEKSRSLIEKDKETNEKRKHLY